MSDSDELQKSSVWINFDKITKCSQIMSDFVELKAPSSEDKYLVEIISSPRRISNDDIPLPVKNSSQTS
jgi:hypothetical protein